MVLWDFSTRRLLSTCLLNIMTGFNQMFESAKPSPLLKQIPDFIWLHQPFWTSLPVTNFITRSRTQSNRPRWTQGAFPEERGVHTLWQNSTPLSTQLSKEANHVLALSSAFFCFSSSVGPLPLLRLLPPASLPAACHVATSAEQNTSRLVFYTIRIV